MGCHATDRLFAPGRLFARIVESSQRLMKLNGRASSHSLMVQVQVQCGMFVIIGKEASYVERKLCIVGR